VNTQVNKNRGAALNAACGKAKKAMSPCVYFKNKDKGKTMPWDVADIEELHTQAVRHQFCPYY